MKVLVVGGTRFFGIPMVEKLISNGHDVTIASRGNTGKSFGDRVKYVTMDRTNPQAVEAALGGHKFDVIIDKVAYCSNDVKHLLDHVKCDRYILMSTCSVYKDEHENLSEKEFDPLKEELVWVDRLDDYAFIKRTAECAVAQFYNKQAYTLVRYPIVLGENDYTKRLLFYVEHIRDEKPMWVDDMEYGMAFISEKEAGEFIAYLVDHPVDGTVNGSMNGLIQIKDIISYIENRTGKKAKIQEGAESAPFNGLSCNWTFKTKIANDCGYSFQETEEYVKKLIDFYILPAK